LQGVCICNYYSSTYHIAVDDYVVDVLLPDLVGHDKSPAGFLVYLILWTLLFRSERRSIAVSLQGLSSQTGLSKSTVQAAVRILRQRGLIKVIRAAPTSVPQASMNTLSRARPRPSMLIDTPRCFSGARKSGQ